MLDPLTLSVSAVLMFFLLPIFYVWKRFSEARVKYEASRLVHRVGKQDLSQFDEITFELDDHTTRVTLKRGSPKQEYQSDEPP